MTDSGGEPAATVPPPVAPAAGRPSQRLLPRTGRLARGALAVLFWSLAEAAGVLPPWWAAITFTVMLTAGFLWWYVLRRGYPGELLRRATLRLRGPGPTLAWVPVVLVPLLAFTLASSPVLAGYVKPTPAPWMEALLSRPHGTLVLAVLAVTLAPLLEEFLFRGWLQRSLERRVPAWVALTATAAVFALVHADAFGFASRFVAGLAMGYLAYVSRSIVPSVVLHASYNGALLLQEPLARAVGGAEVTAAATPSTATAAALAVASLAALVAALVGAGRAAASARLTRRRGTPAPQLGAAPA